MYLLGCRRREQKFYPCYDVFISEVALYIMEHSVSNSNQVLFDVIKNNFKCNGTLYEIVLKMPHNVKDDVDCKVKYYLDNNVY